jgi:nitroreductase
VNMSQSISEVSAMIAEANLAPNVHNTQPTRWRLETDGSILVLEDTTRRLKVGDPSGRDADVSHGAAIEGLALAASRQGLGVAVEPLQGSSPGDLRPAARLSFVEGRGPDELARSVGLRRTYRGAFASTRSGAALDLLAMADDVTLLRKEGDIANIAALNDTASLRSYRHAPFRAELLSWMRLSRSDPRWNLDGMNAEALEMSRFEAAGAGFVLARGVFEIIDRFGIASPLVAEAPIVRSAEAIALFHRPETETPLETGRRFYRFLLEVTAQGLSAAPMAVLADDPLAESEIRQSFGIPPNRRLITAFRLGVAPRHPTGPKPRLPLETLMVT